MEKRRTPVISASAYEKLTGDNKELMIIPGANHVDLYDSPTAIPFEKLKSFLRNILNERTDFSLSAVSDCIAALQLL